MSEAVSSPLHVAGCRVLVVDGFHENTLELSRLMARKRYLLRWASDLVEMQEALSGAHHSAVAVSREIGPEEFDKVIKELRQKHPKMPIVVFTRGQWGEEELEYAAAQIGEAQPAALFAVLDCLVQESEETPEPNKQ